MKRIISLALTCLLLFGLCACENNPSPVGTSPTDDNTATENTASDNKTLKLGDSVELGDVAIQFIIFQESAHLGPYKPADGNIYAYCTFDISNNSKEALPISSLLNFNVNCDGHNCNFACEYAFGALPENTDDLDGAIVPGQHLQVIIGCEVPTDWKELEVHYTLGVFDNSEIVFVATNN